MRKRLLRIWNDFKRALYMTIDHLSNDMSTLCLQVTGASSPRDHDRVKSDSMEKSSNKRGQMFLFRSRYPSSARRAIYPRQGPHLSQFHFGDADVTSYNGILHLSEIAEIWSAQHVQNSFFFDETKTGLNLEQYVIAVVVSAQRS